MGGELRLERADDSRTPEQPETSGLQFFAGWNSGERLPLKAPSDQSIPVTSGGRLSGIDLFKGWKGIESRPSTPAADRPVDKPVSNGVLELRYGDPDFSRKLEQAPAEAHTLKIAGMPAGSTVHYWVDEGGYFIWFKDGHDNFARHHVPAHLRFIEAGGERQDLNMERLRVSQAYMKEQTGLPYGFDDMNGRTNVITYFSRMSNLAEQGLAVQEKILRDGARNSGNPYFSIYLADVLVTQAMQPVIKGMLSGGPVNLENPETLRKIDEAIEELRKAQRLSRDEIEKGRYDTPPGNVALPLAPFALYTDPRAFWGGSLYQSQRREVALTMIRGLIQTGAFRQIQLPPALPPR